MLFRSKIFTGLSVRNQKKRLLASLAVFVVALSIPLAILVNIAFEQFQKDVFFYHLWNSKHVVHNTASDLKMHLKVENNRSIDDYQFYKTRKGNGSVDAGTTLSPLASIPEQSTIPGLLSYFQIDESGQFSCPLLPFSSGNETSSEKINHILSEDEVAQRLSLRKEIKPILEEIGFISDNKNEEDNQPMPGPGSDIEANITVPASNDGIVSYPTGVKKISSLRTKRNAQGYVAIYRNIWNGENKLVQGFVVDEQKFILAALKENFAEAEFGTDVLMQVYYRDDHVASMIHQVDRNNMRRVENVALDTPQKLIDLHQFELPSPLHKYSFAFSGERLPIGDSTKTGGLFLTIIILIIIAGLVVFYRLGIQQINLNEERLNFVSSVSHELKTPLTSIIMYADMLRSGMLTDKTKRNDYYNFIFFEGERLGRLIGNVLRLSKLGQDSADISLEYIQLSTALDLLKSKTSTVLENNGFHLNFKFGDCVPANCSILIDRDAFTQITINLVDNAVKFTAEYLTRDDVEENDLSRQIDINVSKDPNQANVLRLGIRDYGPGIARDDEKHIFKSFYRAGNELTRKTTGTGMGLALVCELAQAMEGNIEFFNRGPGAEFVVSFLCREEEKPS